MRFVRSGLHCQYVQPPSVATKSVQKLAGPVVDVSPSPEPQVSAPEASEEAAAALADAAGAHSANKSKRVSGSLGEQGMNKFNQA